MKHRLQALLGIAVIALSLSGPRAEAAVVAMAGTLDLRENDWRQEARVDLEGEWKFWWNQLVDPSMPVATESITWLPEPWNKAGRHSSHVQAFPSQGCATYRLQILVAPGAPYLALRVPAEANATRIFVNGKHIGDVGTVGCQAVSMAPEWSDRIYDLGRADSVIDLVVQVANFQTAVGGAWKPMELGTQTAVHRHIEMMRSVRIFFAGFLFLMGIYHFVLFVYHRKRRGQLLFLLICLVGSFRLLSPGDHLLAELLPGLPWESWLRLDYMMVGIGFVLVFQFVRATFPKELVTRSEPWLMGAGVLHALACLVMPLHLLIPSLGIAQALFGIGYVFILIALIKAIRHGHGWPAVVFLASMLLFLATIVNDFMYARQLVTSTGYLASYGLVVVVISQWLLMAREYALTFRRVEQSFEGFLQTMGKAIVSKSRYTGDHVQRVAAISELMAVQLMLPDEERRMLRLGALVHDLGKIHLSDEILDKPSDLSEEEMEEVRQHPVRGCRILAKVDELDTVKDIIRHHHEDWDGNGYPDGLKGIEIPFEARIVAVADFWDAITSDRAHRSAMPLEQAIELMRMQAGKHLDPHLVEVFLKHRLWGKM